MQKIYFYENHLFTIYNSITFSTILLRFLSSKLGLKLTSNFNINFGCGIYAIDDARWEPQGLDGEQPSNYEFGLNAGLLWDITDNLGLSIKYNMIEAVAEDRQEGVRKMSINGWALGITFR